MFNICMLESMMVDQYIQLVDEIRNELVAIGHKVNELDLIHNVLKGLPSSWGPFVSTFASKLTDATPPSYGDLIKRLHNKEYWRNNHREEQLQDEAFFTNRSHNNL